MNFQKYKLYKTIYSDSNATKEKKKNKKNFHNSCFKVKIQTKIADYTENYSNTTYQNQQEKLT